MRTHRRLPKGHVDAKETQVVLYRAPGAMDRFQKDTVLATRHFGVSQSCRAGSTDYVGLAGAKRRVVAAYILPRNDVRRVPRVPTLFVSRIDE